MNFMTMQKRRFITLTATALATIAPLGSGAAVAGDVPTTRGAESRAPVPGTLPATRRANAETVVSIVTGPQAFARPALKYRLLPELTDQKPGNAAQPYLMATELLPASTDKAFWDKVDQWMALPLAEMPREAVKAALPTGSLHLADLAARRQYCHWEIAWREDAFATLLPHLSHLRSLCRLVVLRARLEIAEGRFDDAARSLQTCTAMSRHLNDEPFLIQVLVGVAVESVGLTVVDDWLRQPGAPNLYWALAELPRPFSDAKGGMAFERSSIYFQFPLMKAASEGRITASQWDEMLTQLMQMPQIAEGGSTWTKLGTAMVATAQLPRARQFLIDDGMPEAQVKALEAYQAVAAYWVRDYERSIQEITKWYFVPFAQGRAGVQRAEAEFAATHRKGQSTPLSVIVPAVRQIHFTVTKLDRRISALQCVEGIRAYAAGHACRPPESLEAVTDVPMPVDPITGKPFVYTVTKTGFILDGVSIGMNGDVLRYEITLSKPPK